MTLTTTPHSTQQPMAVWNPLLQDDPEGPTFISNTALQSSDPGFYNRTSQSHSGHTAESAQHVPERVAVQQLFLIEVGPGRDSLADPAFELGEVFIAGGQCPGGNQDAAQVGQGFAGW